MRLEFVYQGAKKAIYWLVLDGDDEQCPTKEFLLELERHNPISHKAMVRRFSNHANIGSTSIKKQGHPIARRSNLHVWKTDQGARLLYFNLSDKSIVMTNGYFKGDPEKQQYDRAENLRDDWLNRKR